ncbi:MAG: hypothetical protein AAB477_03225 [Patescibacteria group bacterium]
MKVRKKQHKSQTRANVTAIGTLKQKFHDNFTTVVSPKRVNDEYVPGHGYVSGYKVEAQVYTIPPGENKPDVISASTYSKHVNGDKNSYEKAAEALIDKLRRLNIM